ncbi:MAG: hypothetical protein A2849_01875 [Candidatus Taylorbacteria bacterium RIFCSPHIGHO2_01_FULL_51_15]|uniref:Plasmid stabilization protein n=1 Tax=Candidatus Taylorbacteria bacterium RIFCSPHIGHO2_01_FULL_51_15 TaxID=1802304 RepID=A0A1G2MDH3_9BACT|nr:MAG: hypothetical protein A2849_01875 [Candidatus Taylorbacteria bacterium RIFCSPHIGHO2_01_FULL_51_15]
MSSDDNWDVRVARNVTKALRKFPKKDLDAIEAAVVGMRRDPYFGDIQKLGGQNAWRRRTGSYRISYEVHQEVRLVIVFEVRRRTSTTY